MRGCECFMFFSVTSFLYLKLFMHVVVFVGGLKPVMADNDSYHYTNMHNGDNQVVVRHVQENDWNTKEIPKS